MKEDYYEILGISKGASSSEIKKAYRKKAIEFHPDKNPGDKKAEANFKKAAQAYEILSDPQKKSQYDQFGHSAFESGGFGGGGMNMDDIFSSLETFLVVLSVVEVLGDLVNHNPKEKEVISESGYSSV